MVKQMRTIDDVKRELCGKMRALRERHKYSQEYVAAELGINQNTYSKIESGQTELTLKRVLQVCTVYGQDPGKFFGEVFGNDKNTELMPTDKMPGKIDGEMSINELLNEVTIMWRRLREIGDRVICVDTR